jgi:UPF0755 protein
LSDTPFDEEDLAARPRHMASGGAPAASGATRYVDDDWDDDPYEDDDYYDEDDDFVEVDAGRSGGRKVLLVFLVVLAVFAVLAGAAVLWVQRQIDPPGGPGEVVSLEIPPRTSGAGVASLLEDADVISSSFVWNWYLRWRGVDSTAFEAGLYEFRQNSHFDDAIDILQGGPAPPQADSFTIPEGLTVDQIIDRLADSDRGLGLDAAAMRELLAGGEIRSRYQPPDQPSPEGILFPETYTIPDEVNERRVLEMMVNQLDTTLTELDVESAQERFNLTPYEILIVASLIERETRVDEERPMVARVIYNRLSQGIALGIDATSCYEIDEEPCRLTTADLESETPYNTRRRPGLIPTPIAAPGRASIEAALQPADGPWIYYVLQDEEGNHFFTDSAAEFEQAKEVCRERGLGCG